MFDAYNFTNLQNASCKINFDFAFIPKKMYSFTSPHSQQNRDVELSKLMSWILRHGANEASIPIEANGFIDVEVLLTNYRFTSKRFNLEDVKRVVTNDRKRRFTLDTLPNGKYQIKANQGHSMTNVQMKMTKIDDPSKLPIVVHGTYHRFWKKIKNEGLKRQTRHHIHMTEHDRFSTEISGFRSDCEILIYVNVGAAMKDGISFYRSENDVILTEGIDGVLSNKYFVKVVDRYKNQLIQ